MTKYQETKDALVKALRLKPWLSFRELREMLVLARIYSLSPSVVAAARAELGICWGNRNIIHLHEKNWEKLPELAPPPGMTVQINTAEEWKAVRLHLGGRSSSPVPLAEGEPRAAVEVLAQPIEDAVKLLLCHMQQEGLSRLDVHADGEVRWERQVVLLGSQRIEGEK